ncbi:MAG TPA: hypothetical protein VFM14_11340, partial [Gemmatimonadales bacterium]|nr:hypothetical protein [Gemmatimonadales bacterium]
ITSKARIYHSASDKWLPIEFHPHFKKAREMAAGPVAPAPVQPSPSRTEPAPPQRRTPPPERSPVAGLTLIDATHASKPFAVEPLPAPAEDIRQPELMPPVEPVPHAVLPEVPPVSTPAPAAPPALWMAPTLAEPKPVAASMPAGGQPEPEPAAPQPPAAKAVVWPLSFRTEPDPQPSPEPLPRYTAPAPPRPVFEHVPPPEPVALPEPERDAIFLASSGETDPSESTPVPSIGEAAAAEPSSRFQFPRVDLRRRRRPLLVGAAAITLAASTHLALSSNRERLELGVGVPLPVPNLGPRALIAEGPGSSTSGTTNATVLPASVPPVKGSPSFGGASALAPVTDPAQPTAAVPATGVAPAPAVPAIAPAPKIAIAAPKTVAAPSIDGDLKSASGLLARYDAAHAAARAELDNGLRTAGFANLFAGTRLQPTGLRAARAAVGTASAYVQRYRRREAEIEQAYRDTFDVLSARNKWSDGQRRTWEERKVRQEHPEIVKLSSFLLQSLDSLYGLLAAHDAEYRIADGAITFDNAAASRAYGELKPWLDRRAHAWADLESNEPTTAARILRAMGTAKLPEGGTF